MTMWANSEPETVSQPGGGAAGSGGRSQSPVRWVGELALLALLYVGYLPARAAMGVHTGEAHQRGQQILDVEAMAGLDIERALNALAAAVPAVGLLFAYLYATLHYLVTPVVLVWIALRRSDGYRRARNGLLIATIIGLFGYWLLPHGSATDARCRLHRDHGHFQAPVGGVAPPARPGAWRP